jgi:hypothetical protein
MSGVTEEKQLIQTVLISLSLSLSLSISIALSFLSLKNFCFVLFYNGIMDYSSQMNINMKAILQKR